jgi:hypothetical protein
MMIIKLFNKIVILLRRSSGACPFPEWRQTDDKIQILKKDRVSVEIPFKVILTEDSLSSQRKRRFVDFVVL